LGSDPPPAGGGSDPYDFFKKPANMSYKYHFGSGTCTHPPSAAFPNFHATSALS